jgi:anti-sigma B factor antagonist
VPERLVGLDLEERGEVVIARVTGELDIAEAAQTGEAIGARVSSSALGLVVDLTDLGFIDSSGIAMLFGLVRQLSSRRQVLRVAVRPGGPVARVLDIVEFERAAGVDSDVGEAVAAVEGASA